MAEDRIAIEYTWTLCNGEIIACGGFVPLWTGVFECWIQFKDYRTFLSHTIWLVRAFRKELEKLQFHRLQATIDLKTRNYHKFMKLLGFNCEGLLRKYSPFGEDYVMYSRIK
jgi:hypothetical protein